jgi:hypothetical protein
MHSARNLTLPSDLRFLIAFEYAPHVPFFMEDSDDPQEARL